MRSRLDRFHGRVRGLVLGFVLGFVLALGVVSAVGVAGAVEPDELLADAALEARARAISVELRCLVCQNQSIDDSNAPLARDLRLVVRERLTAGDSDRQIMDFVVARYGEFVLLRPRFGGITILLWLAPLVLLGLGLWLAWGVWRRPDRQSVAATDDRLSAQEEARFAELLRGHHSAHCETDADPDGDVKGDRR